MMRDLWEFLTNKYDREESNRIKYQNQYVVILSAEDLMEQEQGQQQQKHLTKSIQFQMATGIPARKGEAATGY
jgi:hypothetical protein